VKVRVRSGERNGEMGKLKNKEIGKTRKFRNPIVKKS
jgi:hypothetical protein